MTKSFRHTAIIFDLGGVILDIDYELTIAAFQKLGFSDFDLRYSQAQQTGLFDDFEIGKINPSQFVEQINELGRSHFTHSEVIEAWNTMLLNFSEKRIRLLKELKESHRTFLLSNTNEVHLRAFHQIAKQSLGTKDLSPWFEKVYYSHQMGLRKPDAAIFEKVLRDNKLEPKEVLFIDDSIQHVEGAKKIGIDAVLLEKGKDICELLPTLI